MDCMILNFGKINKNRHITALVIFTIGTMTLKYGRKDSEKSSIVMLMINPTHETIAQIKSLIVHNLIFYLLS